MATESSGVVESSSAVPQRSALLTFLIADVRGYTSFTAEKTDAWDGRTELRCVRDGGTAGGRGWISGRRDREGRRRGRGASARGAGGLHTAADPDEGASLHHPRR